MRTTLFSKRFYLFFIQKCGLTSENNYWDMANGITFICFGVLGLVGFLLISFVLIYCTFEIVVDKLFSENKTQVFVNIN